MKNTITQQLQAKLNRFSLLQKLSKLPDVNISLNDKDEKEDKLDELKNRLLSQKLQVGSSYRFASLDSQSEEYVSYFLIKGDETNGRGWGVTNESIPNNIHTFKGMPFVVTSNEFIANSIYGETWDHPDVTDSPKIGLAREGSVDINDLDLIKAFQGKFKVGTIEDVIKVNDTWRAIIRKDKQFIGRQFPPFCSPAIFKHDNHEPENAISAWEGLHLAGLQDRPAYGNIALYKGSCSGTLDSCKTQFRQASSEPCKFTQLRKALSIHNIKSSVLLSPTFQNTQRQNVLTKCPKGETMINGKCKKQTEHQN